MDPQATFAALVAVAARLGIAVKSSALRGVRPGAGGLCRVNGKLVVLLNSKHSVAERSITLADALSTRNLEGIELAPELRSFIAYRGRKVPPRSGVRTAGPGLASTSANGKRRRSAP